MKKGFFITAFITIVLFATPVFGQDGNLTEKNTSPFTYANIPIYQILDAPDAYIILYAKYGKDTGQTAIPKSWAKAGNDNPAKLVFRKLPPTLNPYMTIIRKDGVFYKVYLTLPLERSNSIWGHAPNGIKIDNPDKANLDDLQL
jgi:hypothetical protein